MTSDGPQLRVLFFDVFGTCVAQRPSVAKELWEATQEALKSNGTSISSEVRSKASNMTYKQWDEFADEWNAEEDQIRRDNIARTGTVDWKAVDRNRIEVLPKLLARRGLIILRENTSDQHSGPRVVEGSLWDESQLQHLGLVWHRLDPWLDTCRGLEMLNQNFSTVALSNCYNELLRKLVAHGSMPFKHIYSSDMFESYKPNPKVYLGAAEKLGVKPEECALVAAHLGDLKGAKECGFYAIYVERHLEEKTPELRKENIPDMTVGEDDGGFITLAGRLGIQVD